MKFLSQHTRTWDTPEEIAAHTRPLSRCSSCGYTLCGGCGGCGSHCVPCSCPSPATPRTWEADSPPTPNPVFIRRHK
jgi:hypothetical protein